MRSIRSPIGVALLDQAERRPAQRFPFGRRVDDQRQAGLREISSKCGRSPSLSAARRPKIDSEGGVDQPQPPVGAEHGDALFQASPASSPCRRVSALSWAASEQSFASHRRRDS